MRTYFLLFFVVSSFCTSYARASDREEFYQFMTDTCTSGDFECLEGDPRNPRYNDILKYRFRDDPSRQIFELVLEDFYTATEELRLAGFNFTFFSQILTQSERLKVDRDRLQVLQAVCDGAGATCLLAATTMRTRGTRSLMTFICAAGFARCHTYLGNEIDEVNKLIEEAERREKEEKEKAEKNKPSGHGGETSGENGVGNQPRPSRPTPTPKPIGNPTVILGPDRGGGPSSCALGKCFPL